MYRKNVSGVRGETCMFPVWVSSTPMNTPTAISRHDSGKILESFGVMWKPGTNKPVSVIVDHLINRRTFRQMERTTLAFGER